MNESNKKMLAMKKIFSKMEDLQEKKSRIKQFEIIFFLQQQPAIVSFHIEYFFCLFLLLYLLMFCLPKINYIR